MSRRHPFTPLERAPLVDAADPTSPERSRDLPEPSRAPPADPFESRGDAWARRVSAGIQAGDHACLDEFFRAWRGRCLALIRTRTRRDEHFCLDVLQDSMIRVATSMRAMPDEPSMSRWFARVAWTAALDRIRAEQRRTRREQEASKSERNPADSAPEDVASLRLALESLGIDEHEPLLLRVVLGLTLRSLGRALDTSPDAVDGRVRRTLRRLRNSSGLRAVERLDDSSREKSP